MKDQIAKHVFALVLLLSAPLAVAAPVKLVCNLNFSDGVGRRIFVFDADKGLLSMEDMHKDSRVETHISDTELRVAEYSFSASTNAWMLREETRIDRTTGNAKHHQFAWKPGIEVDGHCEPLKQVF